MGGEFAFPFRKKRREASHVREKSHKGEKKRRRELPRKVPPQSKKICLLKSVVQKAG